VPWVGPAVTTAMPVIPASTKPAAAHNSLRLIELLLFFVETNAPNRTHLASGRWPGAELRFGDLKCSASHHRRARRRARLAREIASCRFNWGSGADGQRPSDGARTLPRFRSAAQISSKSSWGKRIDSGHAASLVKHWTRFLGMSPRGEIASPWRASRAAPTNCQPEEDQQEGFSLTRDRRTREGTHSDAIS